MPDREATSSSRNFTRRFHPDQLDLDQFAAAIRRLLDPQKLDLHSAPDQAIDVVSPKTEGKPN
jgi:hypothetical protein